MIDRPEETTPRPDDRTTTCTTPPRQIAAELRESVQAMRIVQRDHGPSCHGHPVTMGHLMALRIADLLDELAATRAVEELPI